MRSKDNTWYNQEALHEPHWDSTGKKNYMYLIQDLRFVIDAFHYFSKSAFTQSSNNLIYKEKNSL